MSAQTYNSNASIAETIQTHDFEAIARKYAVVSVMFICVSRYGNHFNGLTRVCDIQLKGCEADHPTQRAQLKRNLEAVTKKQTRAVTKDQRRGKVKDLPMSKLTFQTIEGHEKD